MTWLKTKKLFEKSRFCRKPKTGIAYSIVPTSEVGGSKRTKPMTHDLDLNVPTPTYKIYSNQVHYSCLFRRLLSMKLYSCVFSAGSLRTSAKSRATKHPTPTPTCRPMFSQPLSQHKRLSEAEVMMKEETRHIHTGRVGSASRSGVCDVPSKKFLM